MADARRLHAVVQGIVQGVGFRMFVYRTATSLGCSGWVRNRYDGTVEVLAEAPETALLALLKALQTGPRSAEVTHVTVEWQAADGGFAGFEVRSTTG
jgi:acylphosphatase